MLIHLRKREEIDIRGTQKKIDELEKELQLFRQR